MFRVFSEVLSQPGTQLARAVLGQRDVAAYKTLFAMGKASPFSSSSSNMYMGLVRAHLAAEKLHHKFPRADFHVSSTNPTT